MEDNQNRGRGVPRPPRLRSAVTNQRRMFVQGGDATSPWSRRWRDLTELHIADCGGVENMSEMQLSLCRRVSAIEVTLEQMEAQMSAGGDVDFDLYNRLAGNLRRLADSIGLRRVARDVTPTLEAVVAAIHAQKARNDQTD